MGRELIVGSTRIADDTDAFVIAEIGHNHQGDPARARELLRQARASGAAAVKLQKRDNRTLFTSALFNAPYTSAHSFGPTYGAHREALELDIAVHADLMALGRTLGVEVFATVFDIPSAEALIELDAPAFKIASGDLTNIPLLRHVARLGRPIVLSTGGGTFEDIDRAVDAVLTQTTRLCLLQCTARYPADLASMNLNAISALRARYPDLVIGLSDHYHDASLATMAYALGARVIEKHFTLDRRLKGRDHSFSLEPAAFRAMILDLQRARVALGDGEKRADRAERDALLKMSKKLTAVRAMPAGHVLSADDISVRSPGDGLPPWHLETLVGKTLTRPVAAEDALTPDHVDAFDVREAQSSRSNG